MRIILRSIVGFFAVIGFLIFALLIGGVALAIFAQEKPFEIENQPILEMEIDGALPESAASSPLAAFSDTDNSLPGMLAALDAARTDARIVGVFLRIGAQPLPMAQAQELRNALSAFRDDNKPVLAFSESYDDVGFGTGFYLAAAADEVWLQPSGEIGMTGLAIETPYVRELLDEVGILPEFGQRKDYKSFPDTFLRERSSQANKEALQSLAGSLVDQLATGIAESRDLSPASVRAAIDAAPLLATEAADRGLRVIIAGAGGAAHLPGMLAAITPLPVIGVPIQTRALGGQDSLLSIVQMPGGVPVATVAINGAKNAGILATQILGTHALAIREKIRDYKARLATDVMDKVAAWEQTHD